VLACLSWWLVIVWAYLFNGVRDIREDRLNGSRRPIASGRLPATMAHYMAVACAVLAVVSGVALGGVVGLLVPAMVVLGYAYSARPFSLKSRPVGSPAFAFTLGISSYYAGYAACVGGYPTPDRSFVVLAVAASLWTALVGSIAKDLPDVGGDAAAGRRSLTVIAGDRTARLSLSGAALAVGGVFCVLAETTAAALMPAAVAALAGAVAVSVIGLSEFSRGSRSRRRRPYRAFMCTQYCVHILVVVSATVP
jgi:4-hydroxybenzoate polyprenyltransferase